MKASECVLYSGGLKGAEAAFGATAERYGIEEVNFTFDGHRANAGRTHAEPCRAAARGRQSGVRREVDESPLSRYRLH
jgi:hypothetical protein